MNEIYSAFTKHPINELRQSKVYLRLSNAARATCSLPSPLLRVESDTLFLNIFSANYYQDNILIILLMRDQYVRIVALIIFEMEIDL
jgi:hypothetical protein